MRSFPALLSMLLASTSLHAQTQLSTKPYTLTLKENQICKTEPGVTGEVCYRLLSKPQGDVFPAQIELVEKMTAFKQYDETHGPDQKIELSEMEKFGGALFIDKEIRDRVVRGFRVLSVQKIGVDWNRVQVNNGVSILPFVTVVYWEGQQNTEGTLFVEGAITLPPQSKSNNEAGSLVRVISDYVNVRSISDASEADRAARVAHFQAMYGSSVNTDEQTVKLVKEVITPFVAADSIYTPFVKGIAEAISDALGKALQDLGGSLRR